MIPIEPLNDEGRARHRCEGCGVVTGAVLAASVSAGKVRCRCRRSAGEGQPGVVQRVVNFVREVARHARGGFVAVSDETRANRLAVCQACPLFDGKICTHKNCGCSIKRTAEWIDKLSWASSACPIGKWPAEVPKEN